MFGAIIEYFWQREGVCGMEPKQMYVCARVCLRLHYSEEMCHLVQRVAPGACKYDVWDFRCHRREHVLCRFWPFHGIW